MKKLIPITKDKDLILKKVIRKRFKNLANDKVNKAISEFQNTLMLFKPLVFGSLVICDRETHILDSGLVKLDIVILVQASDYQKMRGYYSGDKYNVL